MDTEPKFHAEAPQATVSEGHSPPFLAFLMSEGLAQGPYVAATVGVEPMTLRTKGVDSTNAPHTPHIDVYHKQQLLYINSCNHLIKVLSLHRDSICHSPHSCHSSNLQMYASTLFQIHAAVISITHFYVKKKAENDANVFTLC